MKIKFNLFQLGRFMSYYLQTLLAAIRVIATIWGFFWTPAEPQKQRARKNYLTDVLSSWISTMLGLSDLKA